MSIRRKLIATFTIISIITIFACLLIFNQVIGVDKKYSETLDKSVPQSQASAELSRLIMAQTTLVQNYILGKDTLQAIQARRDEVNGLITTLDQSIPAELTEARTLLNSVKDEAVIMYNGFDEAIRLKDEQGLEIAADFYIAEAGMNVIGFMDQTTALTAEISKAFDAAQADAAMQTNRALIMSIVAIVVVVLTGIVASYILLKGISKPLNMLQRYVKSISDGNLQVEPLQIQSKDEIGSLAEAIQMMHMTLKSLLQNLSENAVHLHSTSQQLIIASDLVTDSSETMLDGAKKGSESSSAMALSAQESAIAMDETARAVQSIAETSQQLHNFASRSEELAAGGAGNIRLASNQMSSIYNSTKLTTELIQKLSQQSKEIESITQVITSISEQTNLLALNAAIEAARAGEHGKGFAVVADEVRKLAEESNRSASEIVALTTEIQHDTKNVENAIETSLQDVEQGVEIIQNAGISFEEIVSAIGDMKIQIADVSAMTEEISATAEEVAASVSEVAKFASLTKENAESSYVSSKDQLQSLQQISKVATDLSGRSEKLQEVVLTYKV